MSTMLTVAREFISAEMDAMVAPKMTARTSPTKPAGRCRVTKGSWIHDDVSRHFGSCAQCREVDPFGQGVSRNIRSREARHSERIWSKSL